MEATAKETVGPLKPTITVDPALDELFKGKILFSDKLALAEEQIRQYGLPGDVAQSQSQNETSFVSFGNESEFENYVFCLVESALSKISTDKFILLDNKRVADIVICRETRQPALFFLEAKYHQKKHGRIGFGSGKGAGFQPEILNKRPKYFDSNFKWVLSGDFTDKIYLLNNDKASMYVSGGSIGSKYNNFKRSLFNHEVGLTESEFVDQIIRWLTK